MHDRPQSVGLIKQMIPFCFHSGCLFKEKYKGIEKFFYSNVISHRIQLGNRPFVSTCV